MPVHPGQFVQPVQQVASRAVGGVVGLRLLQPVHDVGRNARESPGLFVKVGRCGGDGELQLAASGGGFCPVTAATHAYSPLSSAALNAASQSLNANDIDDGAGSYVR